MVMVMIVVSVLTIFIVVFVVVLFVFFLIFVDKIGGRFRAKLYGMWTRIIFQFLVVRIV